MSNVCCICRGPVFLGCYKHFKGVNHVPKSSAGSVWLGDPKSCLWVSVNAICTFMGHDEPLLLAGIKTVKREFPMQHRFVANLCEHNVLRCNYGVHDHHIVIFFS